MAITIAAFQNSQTVSTTELSIPGNAAYSSASPQTGVGKFECLLDLSALVAGDIFRFQAYETVRTTGGTQRRIYKAEFTGAQVDPLWDSPGITFGVGWDMTLIRIGSVDRVIPARIVQLA